MAKDKDDIGFLYKKLVLGPLLREEEPKGKYPKGRIKQVFDIFGAEMNGLMRVNVLFLLFLLPLLALVFGHLSMAQASAVSGYNFMGNIGMAYPGGSDDVVRGLTSLYAVYQRVLFYAVPLIMIASIGVAGSFNCYKKYMWGEKVQKVTRTFFKGVKNNWWKYLIVITIDALLALALGSTVVYFMTQKATGALAAGDYVLLVFVCIFEFLILYYNMFLLPFISELDLPFGKVIKDALIIGTKYAIIGMPLFLIMLVPLALFFVNNTFLTLILGVVLLMFGSVLYGLVFTAISQAALNDVIEPLYQLSLSPKAAEKKIKKGKNKNKNPNAYKGAAKGEKPISKNGKNGGK